MAARGLGDGRGRERVARAGPLQALDGHLRRSGAARTRHPGGLELDGCVRAAAEQGAPGCRDRQRRGQRRVDDVEGVGGLLHAQRDPQVGVGLDLRAHHARRPLGGEHQVQPERAADGGEPHQPGDEVGQLLGQHAELVDHEHQPRQGGQVGPGGVAQGQVGVQVRRAGGRQHALAAAHLGAERLQRAGGEGGVEVGDQADGVREPGALRERRPALVVDQHERQLVRTVRQREAGHQGLEQLALAGAGGAGHQRVRAVAAQVDGDRPAGAHAEDGGGAARLLVPAAHDGPGGERTVRGDQVEQAHLVGQPAARLRAWRRAGGRARGRGGAPSARPRGRPRRRRPARCRRWRPAAGWRPRRSPARCRGTRPAAARGRRRGRSR